MSMNAGEKRLIGWNRFWMVLALVAVAWAVFQQVRQEQGQTRLTVAWQDGDIWIRSGSDGPYVVTHLAVSDPGHGIEVTAALAPPIAVTESGRTAIPAKDLAVMRWRNRAGDDVPGPAPGTPLRALWLPGRWTPRE